MHWAAEFIGIPWSPERNCWWLVREVFRVRLGIELPHLGDSADSVAVLKGAAMAAGIRPAPAPPQEMDVILCRDLTGKRHVGVMIEWNGRLQLLHNDGHMSERGPVGSVIRQPLADALQLTALEFWRRA